MRKADFSLCEKRAQIRCAVTAQLISGFDFATWIVQPFFLNPKFQASGFLLYLHRPVCVRPRRKSERPVFARRGSNNN